ncbi:Ebp2-domain-containing protein [Dissoconium aciculare CBS 342.82]|uniref:Ebp2-domain-containing protein n=1 Tax=Dissoconium aciculare CBS 342.82 TaxID=1314786 RepID=A0A6J3M652_9PEZI|nr:Ebp2-domain-containing protein [Dissoconium aciculare CBS 342.82]KAF1822337.1 Ebp2-domain-containing protein [Dissoconium aciculare CBS 342.82]
MAKSKLKAALDREQGVNYKLERQKKLQKVAEKRKRQKAPKIGEVEEDEEEDVADGSDLEIEEFDDDAEQIPKLVKTKVAIRNKGAPQDDEDEDEDEDEEDIPLSDIESLASEDRADVVPHQRLTINNTAALLRSLKSFALPAMLPFSAVQSVTSENPVVIADVEDDLNRELAFYRQSLDAVTEARRRLKKEGIPFTRPTDYFAEMVKSEEQMGKVRTKMLDSAARQKASADARRQRDLKKFGKAVQVAKLQERQKEKRETLDRISTLKRKRQGADLTTNEGDMFDVALEDAAVTASKDRAERRAKGAADGPNRKRQKKDSKFGFGGKKRFSKSNDAQSAGDMSGYSVKKMKGGGKPGKSRPGKSKRARM